MSADAKAFFFNEILHIFRKCHIKCDTTRKTWRYKCHATFFQ